ncbi:DUF58 domain-containing protein [Puniceicoccus vermicola]|uniref:DUF58 domain-containing protein n=1 Tax=Puniceicoccus vermicola TaxID=388746 RepID=A0A7X1B143_9BACT|nr:DUF58 domain-containing protein [Puniceicoccus vermicola]MBC2603713.1 DUF58 domain-containing protein [Puniceicoccus vermicola]
MAEQEDQTREIIRKVRRLEIRTNRMVTDALSGAYHSVFKGQGMDFEEVREYAPGDEIRSIDWNVTARMDRPFVKIYREERELTLMLLVDLSASGSFGSASESKRELAAEIASVLAFAASRNNDKVGLLIFTDRIETYVPPRKGRYHILRVIREILYFQPEGKGTDLPDALDHMNRLLKRKAVVFLISDFLQGPDGRLPDPEQPRGDAVFQALSRTHRRHDLTTIFLSDEREHSLPPVGRITLEDSETGETVELDTSSRRVRDRYEKENRDRLAKMNRAFNQLGLGSLALSTGEPYIHHLRRYLEKRERQR